MFRRVLPRVVAALPFVVLLYTIGYSPWGLWEPDEGRYADIGQAMLDSGDFVTPRLNGEIYLDKPPLVYWVTAAGLAAWGSGETGARFGQTIFAAGCLLLTWWLGRLLFDDRRGRLAAIVLASAIEFFAGSHLLTLDLALTFFVALTLICFLKGYRAATGAGPWFLAMWAAAAAAVLTKGPIGAVLPGLTIVAFLWIRRDLKRLRDLRPVSGPLLFLAIAAPWYLAVSWRNPDFPRYFFLHEHVQRFFSTVHRRPGPPYYYVPVALLGLLPWTLILPAHVIRQRSRILSMVTLRSEAGAMVAAWILPGFLLFSLAQSKLPLYLLPLFPAVALAIAVCVDADLRRNGLPGARFLWPAVALAGLGLGAALVWRRAVLATVVRQFPEASGMLATVALLLVGAMALGWLLCRRGRFAAGLTGAACLWMLAIHMLMTGVGRMNYFNETRYFASVLRADGREADQPVYQYDAYLRGLPFYMRDTTLLVDYKSEELAYGLQHGGAERCLASEDRFLTALQDRARVFAVVRRPALVGLLEAIDRPLYLLAMSKRHALVSNQLSPERAWQTAEFLAAAGSDFHERLESAARLMPDVSPAIIELEREGGMLQATLSVARDQTLVQAIVPLDPPGTTRVQEATPAGEETRREHHVLRVVVPNLRAAEFAQIFSRAGM